MKRRRHRKGHKFGGARAGTNPPKPSKFGTLFDRGRRRSGISGQS